jgi:hypothetical protein
MTVQLYKNFILALFSKDLKANYCAAAHCSLNVLYLLLHTAV